MSNSRSKVGVASLVFGLALGVVGSVGSSSVIADRPTTDKKVTICHATGSESKPYVKINVSYSAVNGSEKDGHGDHLNHTGPVWYPGAKAAGVRWGDIIPPVAGVTPGLNWSAGQSIFNNNCKVPATTTPTTVKATTTTVKATTTTVKATTTTAPKQTTTTVKAATTTAPKQTTTTAVSGGGQTTTTAPKQTTTTAVKGTPTTAPKQTTTTAVLSGAQTTTTAVLSSGGTVPGSEGLPKTGRESSGMLLLAGLFVFLGATLMFLKRKPVVG